MKNILFLTILGSLGFPDMADASFFGFIPAPCQFGDNYDSDNKNCYYCPKGSEMKDGDCKSLPTIGDRCTHGRDVRYHEENRRCVYCQHGYVFLFRNNKCTRRSKFWEDL